MSARHEIPTELGAPDDAAWGLTMRQLLLAASGLALAYGAWLDLPLPGALRLCASALVLAATLALLAWRPQGRPLEEWALVLCRYAARPRLAAGGPPPGRRGAPRAREVVLPGPPRAATVPSGGARGGAARAGAA